MANFIDDYRAVCGSKENVWLVTANLTVSVVLMIAGFLCGYFHLSDEWTVSMFSVSANPAEVLRHPWTVLTYMVTQYSILHLIINLIWLFWFGRIAVMVISGKGMLRLYLIGGIAGAFFYILASILPDVHSAGYLCGSSASVLAIMSACAIIAPNMPLRFLFGEIRLKWLAVICILLAFVGSSTTSVGGQIAHAGGLLTGIGIGFLVKTDIISDRLSINQRPRRLSKPRKNRPVRTPVLSEEAAENVKNAFANRLSDEERLDQLLDKIRLSGYNSLSAAEKRELNAISNRISEQ